MVSTSLDWLDDSHLVTGTQFSPSMDLLELDDCSRLLQTCLWWIHKTSYNDKSSKHSIRCFPSLFTFKVIITFKNLLQFDNTKIIIIQLGLDTGRDTTLSHWSPGVARLPGGHTTAVSDWSGLSPLSSVSAAPAASLVEMEPWSLVPRSWPGPATLAWSLLSAAPLSPGSVRGAGASL